MVNEMTIKYPYLLPLAQLLTRLQKNHLYVKGEKCELHINTIYFLGYIINVGGVAMDPKHVRAVTEWPQPKGVKNLKKYLGFLQLFHSGL